MLALLTCLLFLVFVAGCDSRQTDSQSKEAPEMAQEDVMSGQQTDASFVLTSSAFAQGESIPAQYSCDDADISPPLAWSGAPAGVESFALVMDDPDAPARVWVHWVIFNIPASVTGLPEAVPAQARLADGSIQGTNSWQRSGYGGPCPPGGQHRYFFKLYALDSGLALDSAATKSDLLNALKGRVLAQTELMGVYRRR